MAALPTHEVLAAVSRRRAAMQKLVDDVADGVLTLAEVFRIASNTQDRDHEQDHERVEACRFVYVVKVVEVLPGVGKVRARRTLAACGYGERTRVGEVSSERHDALVEAFA
jgi:hypothetical protein